MADHKPGDPDLREGGGDSQSSMTIRVYKATPDGNEELVPVRIVGPREQLVKEPEPMQFPPCTCPTCRTRRAGTV